MITRQTRWGARAGWRERWRRARRALGSWRGAGGGGSRRPRLAALACVCGVSLAAGLWAGVPAALRAARAHAYFALSSIEIDGNRRLTRRDVLEWAGVTDGSSVWDAKPTAIRRRLLRHPAVRSVHVERELPRRLRIAVQERRPVAILVSGGLQYVDRDGHVIGPLRDADSRDFPLITGFDADGAGDLVGMGVHRALQLLRWCERLNAFDDVSEIHVDRHRGLTVFPRRTAVAVVIGWGQWRDKLRRSARVFAAWEGHTERLALVDLSFRDQVVVRLHPEERAPNTRPTRRGTRV